MSSWNIFSFSVRWRTCVHDLQLGNFEGISLMTTSKSSIFVMSVQLPTLICTFPAIQSFSNSGVTRCICKSADKSSVSLSKKGLSKASSSSSVLCIMTLSSDIPTCLLLLPGLLDVLPLFPAFQVSVGSYTSSFQHLVHSLVCLSVLLYNLH